MIFSLSLISSLEMMQCYELKSPDSHGRRDNLTTEALEIRRAEGCHGGHRACRDGATFMWLCGTGGATQGLGQGAEVGSCQAG